MVESYRKGETSIKLWLNISFAVLMTLGVVGEQAIRFQLASDFEFLKSTDHLTKLNDAFTYNTLANVRYLFNTTSPMWTLDLHLLAEITKGTLITHGGSQEIRDQAPIDRSDLSWSFPEFVNLGKNSDANLSIDRLRLTYHTSSWRLSIGHFPNSWGRGITFHPLDVFNSYPPTIVDRTFKQGNHCALFESRLNNGVELQILGISRDLDIDGQSSSSTHAAKIYLPLGESEIDLIRAEHYDDTIHALSFAVPFFGTLIRTDYSKTCSNSKCFDLGVVNIDYSWSIFNTILYTYIEYFHNGVGVTEFVNEHGFLPHDLDLRVGRGDLHTVGRDSVALGAHFVWHPLWSQTSTTIANLRDRSFLFHTYFTYSPSDELHMNLGFRLWFADDQTEYGRRLQDERELNNDRVALFFDFVYFR